jgi:glycerophosphoryl diester phosphodiesterase
MIPSGCKASVVPRHPYFDGPYPRAYAHRGWHIDDLAGCENTLAAFHRAVAEGFTYLEMDVHASADRVAVVHTTRRWTARPTAAGRSALTRSPRWPGYGCAAGSRCRCSNRC